MRKTFESVKLLFVKPPSVGHQWHTDGKNAKYTTFFCNERKRMQ